MKMHMMLNTTIALHADEYSRPLTKEGLVSYCKTLGVTTSLKEIDFFQKRGLLIPLSQKVSTNPNPLPQRLIPNLVREYYVAEHLFLLRYLQSEWRLVIKNETLDPNSKTDVQLLAEKIQDHRNNIEPRCVYRLNRIISTLNIFYAIRGHYNRMLKQKRKDYHDLLLSSPSSASHLDLFGSIDNWIARELPKLAISELRRLKITVSKCRELAQLFGEEGFAIDPLLNFFLEMERRKLLTESQVKELDGPALCARRYYEVSGTLFWFVQHSKPSKGLFSTLESLYRNNHYRSDQRCQRCSTPLPVSTAPGRPRKYCPTCSRTEAKKASIYGNRKTKVV